MFINRITSIRDVNCSNDHRVVDEAATWKTALRKIYFSLNKYLLEYNAMISIYILRRNSTILSLNIYIRLYIWNVCPFVSVHDSQHFMHVCVCLCVCAKSQAMLNFCLCWDFSAFFVLTLFKIVFPNELHVCVGVCVYECVSVKCLRYVRIIYIAVKMPDRNVQNAKETPHMFDKHCLCILCLIVFDSRVNNCRFCRYFAVWFT